MYPTEDQIKTDTEKLMEINDDLIFFIKWKDNDLDGIISEVLDTMAYLTSDTNELIDFMAEFERDKLPEDYFKLIALMKLKIYCYEALMFDLNGDFLHLLDGLIDAANELKEAFKEDKK